VSPETVTPGLDVVVEALRTRRLRVLWGPIRFVGLPAAVLPLKEFATVSREVLLRAQAFREQLRTPDMSLLLVLPDMPPVGTDQCISCGVPIPCGFRCEVCLVAVWIALGLMPEDLGS
jgi:hypothetical protein